MLKNILFQKVFQLFRTGLNLAVQNIKNYNDNFEYRVKITGNKIKCLLIKGDFETTGVTIGITQDLISKPISKDDLNRIINKYLIMN